MSGIDEKSYHGFKIVGYQDHEECWIQIGKGWKLFSSIKTRNNSRNKK